MFLQEVLRQTVGLSYPNYKSKIRNKTETPEENIIEANNNERLHNVY
jgi:hypothetical protein